MSVARRAGTVARRYARALFEAARDGGALAEVRADAALLARAFEGAAAIAFLADPREDDAAKRARIEQGLGAALHPLTRALLGVLERRRRLGLLAEIPHAFRDLDDAHAGRVRGVIETAQPLDEAARARLARALSRPGREVVLESRAEPALLGGARVTFGGTRLDGSLRGALDALRRRMLEAELR